MTPVVTVEASESRQLRGAEKSAQRSTEVARCPRCHRRPVGGYVQGVGYCCRPCADAICGVSDR